MIARVPGLRLAAGIIGLMSYPNTESVMPLTEEALVGQPELLVLRHSEIESLGTLAPVLQAGARLRTLEAHRGEPRYAREVDAVLRQAGFDAVIVLGGPASLLDRQTYSFLDESLRVVRQALKRDLPVLGIGLGSHLLAWSLDALVWFGGHRGKGPEIGWYPVDLTERGSVEPALHGLGELDSVFHWHHDSFDLPAGAWLLASTALYRNQAFRWGRWVYGIQFHVEVTGRMVEEWVDARAAELAGLKRADPDLIVARAARYCPRLRPIAETMAAHFLECVRASMREKAKLGAISADR